MKWFRRLRLRWLIGDLEAAVESHIATIEDADVQRRDALLALRRARDQLALLARQCRVRVISGARVR